MTLEPPLDILNMAYSNGNIYLSGYYGEAGIPCYWEIKGDECHQYDFTVYADYIHGSAIVVK